MSEVIDVLGWLERWYQENCDGEWEHHFGVSIETLDNPGWRVKVDLRGVAPEAAVPRALAVVGKPFGGENGNEEGTLWMECKGTGGKFVGTGDPTQLRAILMQLRRLFEPEAT